MLGGFGFVYYGKLEDGQEVAVKVLDVKSSQGPSEFFNEVDVLSRVSHRNLVSLIGYCLEDDQQMLIYEYMHKGSLYDHLYGHLSTSANEQLDWTTRLHIALNASQGLEYLHSGCNPSIIHHDVKTSNILLPSDMKNAKVADFGLSRLTHGENITHITTNVKGTTGYLDPEYFTSRCLSVKSDVYSFGVVLLEIISGRKAIDTTLPNREAWNLCRMDIQLHVTRLMTSCLFQFDHVGVNPYSLAQVIIATDNFRIQIGKGGFGPVYYGILEDGQEVAVKVLDVKSSQGPSEFFYEVDVLSKVNHRNLVSLIGYCLEDDQQMLIYEYMHKGSLYDHLYGNLSTSTNEQLDWTTRLHIALNASQGLEYLHWGCNPSIIHRDVKTSNILLPSDMKNAKVAYFGLSRLTHGENITHITTNVNGTSRYLDPEFFTSQCLSLKSDVYSFGVVLLEIIFGCKAIDTMLPNQEAWNLCDLVSYNHCPKHLINRLSLPIPLKIIGCRTHMFQQKVICQILDGIINEMNSLICANPYSLAEVATATNNFKIQIGKGGFGPVYYGKLEDGKEVAIKVLDVKSSQGPFEFFNEVDVLSRVSHRNLVSLIGYCLEDDQQMLIYEYMQKGSLSDHLYASTNEQLDWTTRLHIALNASQGLEYLHSGCNPIIIHRDVKTNNILLPSDMKNAKVADFGLSRLTYGENITHVTTNVKGTVGYIDPEYFTSQCLSIKSDVYSFGVVLLEIISGRKAIDTMLPNRKAWNLCDWVRFNLQEGNMNKILDPIVKASNPNLDSIWIVAEIAIQCVEPKAIHRPTMTKVVEELRAAITFQECNALPSNYSHSMTYEIQNQFGSQMVLINPQ
ncbi:unnamed protein product [Sphagnum jensenii]|uniref:Protein kinase domain-containing protein n=1 Tax=Sphagnum jensenii TaxID=128206 RepID=A0ABP1B4J2_9BRYO